MSQRTKNEVLISLVTVFMVMALAITVIGCGGSDQSSTTTTQTGTTGGATGGTTGGATTGAEASQTSEMPMPSTIIEKPVDQTATKYADEYAVNWEFKPNQDTPSFFKDALGKKKPVFIEFYGEGDALSEYMNAGVQELQNKYSDKVVFIFLNSDRPSTYGSLAEQLPIKYTPQIFILNGKSTIIRTYEGYTDKSRLEQGIYDAIYRGY